MQITITNGTLSQISETLSASLGYGLPEESKLLIDGATVDSYSQSTGVLTLAPTSDTIEVEANGVQTITLDISALSGWGNVSAGTHTLTIKAKATGYYDSQASAGVQFTKAASGYQVMVNAADYGAPSTDTNIYDGQDTTAPLIYTIEQTDHTQHTVTITSGYMYIEASEGPENVSTSGGVVCVNEDLNGILYSVSADGTVEFIAYCLSGDTLVTMADRSTKRLDEIEVGDCVLSFNWDTMELVPNKVIYTDKDEHKSFGQYDVWTFDNGIEVKTIHRHEFYNVEAKCFKYMDEWEIGEHIYCIDGTTPMLIKHEVVNEEINHYKITCENGTNYFANGLLTGDRNCPKNKDIG